MTSTLMNRQRRLFASAIQTSVLAACPAIAGDLIAEMFARAMQSDGEIVPGQTQICRDLANIPAIQINELKQLAVLLRHIGKQPTKTLAKQSFLPGVGHIRQFPLKPLQPSLAGVLATIEINDRAAQNPVKPRYRVFSPGWRSSRSQRFNQTFLHHVFRQLGISDALARERHEDV